MDKKTNKAKLEIFKFLRISALLQGYLIKLEVIMPYLEIITKICLLGYFCMQNSYLR